MYIYKCSPIYLGGDMSTELCVCLSIVLEKQAGMQAWLSAISRLYLPSSFQQGIPQTPVQFYTFSASRLLFISAASIRVCRSALDVSAPLSLPAKSTKENLPCSFPFLRRIIWKQAWEREELEFANVCPDVLEQKQQKGSLEHDYTSCCAQALVQSVSHPMLCFNHLCQLATFSKKMCTSKLFCCLFYNTSLPTRFPMFPMTCAFPCSLSVPLFHDAFLS